MKYFIDGIDIIVIGYINVVLVVFKVIFYGGVFCKVSFKRWFSVDVFMFEDLDIGCGDFIGISFYWYCR